MEQKESTRGSVERLIFLNDVNKFNNDVPRIVDALYYIFSLS